MKLRESDPFLIVGVYALATAFAFGVAVGLLIVHFWK
jgi:hypothetical protein